MPHNEALTHENLRTPKAAAIAGIVFSVLLISFFWLLRLSIPADPMDSGAWIATSGNRVAFALNLVPFSGVVLPLVYWGDSGIGLDRGKTASLPLYF